MQFDKTELEALLDISRSDSSPNRLTISNPINRWENERNLANLKAVMPVVFDNSLKAEDIFVIQDAMENFNDAMVGCVAIK